MIDSQASLVLVAGDAGIGKSRLVSEMLAISGTHLLGSCLPLRRQRALLPFQEMFASDEVRGRVDRALATMAPGLVACLAGVLPEKVDGPPDLPPTTRTEVDADRVFIGIHTLLTAMAASSPLLVVVEDVHWADPTTLDLLTFLGAQLRDPSVTLVATYRTDDPDARSPEMLAWMSHAQRAEVTEVLPLGRLGREEVATQIESLLGEPAPGAIVDSVFRRGEGNPFFTEQLVAAMTSVDQQTELPQRLVDFLQGRVRGAAADGTQLLEVLAVAGRPLRIRSLAHAAGFDDNAARRALTGLVDAALVEVDAGERVRARHALLNEAVLREVPTSDRAELHRRLATILAEDEGDVLAAEIAGHWHAARDSSEELRWAERAAEIAWSVGAWRDAAGWLCRVLDLVDVLGGGFDLVRGSIVDLWCRAIRATDLAGDGIRAVEMGRLAYQRYRDWPLTTERARLARYVAHGQMVHDRDPRAGQATLESVLPALERLPSTEEYADVLLLYASAFVWQGEGHRAVPILERAVAVAEACGSANVMTMAILKLAQASDAVGDSKRAADLLLRAADAAAASRDPISSVAVAVDRSDHLLESGELDEARTVALEALEVARMNGLAASWMPHILVFNAAEAALEQGLTEIAAELVTDLTDHPLRKEVGPLEEIRAEVDLRHGLVTESLSRLEATSSASSIDDLAAFYARKTWVRRWSGQPGPGLVEAMAIAERAAGTDAGQQSSLLASAAGAAADLADLARARRSKDELAAAGAAVDRLRELSALFDGGTRERVQQPVDHLEFLAELTRADGHSDPISWGALGDAWTGLGRPHRAAYAWWRFAEAHLDNAGDRTPTRIALQKAFELSDGHVPLRGAVTELAGRARVRLVQSSVPAVAESGGSELPVRLTDQETKVLRLVAAGMTNRQIGTELFISPKTVSVHVSNVLRKLDVHSRVQAAAWADQVGLGPSDL